MDFDADLTATDCTQKQISHRAATAGDKPVPSQGTNQSLLRGQPCVPSSRINQRRLHGLTAATATENYER